MPEKYRTPRAWVTRLAKCYTSNEPKLTHLFESLDAKLLKGDEKIEISKEELESMDAPVTKASTAFPSDTTEQIRKDAG